jgi:hypothetical protein
MALHELSNLRADFLERLLPADLLEPILDPLQRNPKPVRRVMDLVVAKALDARVTLADHVIVVGLEGNDAIALDGGSEAASRLTNTAKRKLCSGGHDRKVPGWARAHKPERTASSGPAGAVPGRLLSFDDSFEGIKVLHPGLRPPGLTKVINELGVGD